MALRWLIARVGVRALPNTDAMIQRCRVPTGDQTHKLGTSVAQGMGGGVMKRWATMVRKMMRKEEDGGDA